MVSIGWRFLRQYGLHGVLCDEMGLGKTLQTLCIVASDRVEHEQFIVAALRDGTDDGCRRQFARLFGTDSQVAPPSLIVCPPTLQWHWANECKQYCGSVLRPCVLTGYGRMIGAHFCSALRKGGSNGNKCC
jgi:TATA-binding protein-associated factor